MGLQSEQKKVGRHALASPPHVDLEEVRGYTRSNAYNYVQIRGRKYRFSTDRILCLETCAYFFFFPTIYFDLHVNLFRFYLPVLDQKSGAGPKIRRQQKKKKKSLAGESVGEVQCAGSKPPLSCRPATISLPQTHTPPALCVLHTAYFHLRRAL